MFKLDTVKKRFIAVITILLATMLVVLLYVVINMTTGIGLVCYMKKVFDIDCPGCGATRMCIALLHGQIYQAFRFNPFMFISIPILTVVGIWQSYIYIRYNRELKYFTRFLVVYAISLALFGIVRNINLFSFLAPTYV